MEALGTFEIHLSTFETDFGTFKDILDILRHFRTFETHFGHLSISERHFATFELEIKNRNMPLEQVFH